MLEIIPAILTQSKEEAKNLISLCEGVVDRVQIDIIDGKFANNKTIDPSNLLGIESYLSFDFHLMVEDPIQLIEMCAAAGADRIIGQVEKMPSQVDFISKVVGSGLKVGLALDIDTPITAIEPSIMLDLDVILVMSVKAGFGGQKFVPKVIKKIQQLNEIRSRDDTPFRICDDGGVTFETIDDVRTVGVDEVAIGRMIFEGDLRKNIEILTKKAYQQ